MVSETPPIGALAAEAERLRASGDPAAAAALARRGIDDALAEGRSADAAALAEERIQALDDAGHLPALLVAAGELSVIGQNAGDVRAEALGCHWRSLALQSLGQNDEALRQSHAAVRLLDGSTHTLTLLRALLGLIRALVEDGDLDGAWDQREDIRELVGEHSAELGEADLLLWARFNLECADLRLQDGIADAATADCLAEAECALDRVGADPADRARLDMNRARWQWVAGDAAEAERILAAVIERHRGGDFLAFLIPVYRLWGQVLEGWAGHGSGAEARGTA